MASTTTSNSPLKMYCSRCGGTLRETEFYLSKNKEKYPMGRIDVCKKCLTAHLDNFNPDTYLWILEDLDVPYVPDEWNSLIDKFSGGDPSKLKKTSILGRYLSKMQLTQYCEYKWKDTAHLQEKKEKRVAEAMKLRGFSQAEIDEVIEKGAIQIPDHPKELAVMAQIQPSDGLPSQRTGVSYADDPLAVRKSPEDYFEEQSNIKEGQLVGELTPEDEKYLLLKWGKTYRPYEWVKLEDLYQKMYESYDIQGAGHEDTLILVCKTSLKANQLLDIGDVEGAQKMVKMYDGLMKSGKFTAAQNKAKEEEHLDSISELVAMCEKEGFIPRFYIDSPNDKVDETLFDLKSYTKSLVMEELNLGNLIENAVKAMSEEESKEEDEDTDEVEEDIGSLLTYPSDEELDIEDYNDFNDFIESQSDGQEGV